MDCGGLVNEGNITFVSDEGCSQFVVCDCLVLFQCVVET